MKATTCELHPGRPGASQTEDLVYLLHSERVETGIDLQGLIAVAAWFQEILGRESPGQVYRAGTIAPVEG